MNVTDFYNDLIIAASVGSVGWIMKSYLSAIKQNTKVMATDMTNLKDDFFRLTTKVNNLENTTNLCHAIIKDISQIRDVELRIDHIIKDAYSYANPEDYRMLELINTIGKASKECIHWGSVNKLSDLSAPQIKGKYETCANGIRLSLSEMESDYIDKVQKKLRQRMTTHVNAVIDICINAMPNSKFSKFTSLTELMLHDTLQIVITERTIFNNRKKN